LIVGTRGVLLGGEGDINVTSWDSSAGTWVPETSTVNIPDNNQIKLAFGQSFYKLNIVGSHITPKVTIIGISGSVFWNYTNLDVARSYNYYIDDVWIARYIVPDSGILGFSYSSWSTHTFELREAPLITPGSVSDLTQDELIAYSQSLTADQAGTWTLTTTAEWLSVLAGTVSGTPDSFDGGFVYTISIRFANTNGNDSVAWNITVNDSFDAIVTDAVLSASYGGSYVYDVDTDKELAGIAVTYTVVSNWYAININSTTGLIDINVGDSGTYWCNVTVTDSDGKTVWQNWSITIDMLGWDLRVLITYEEGAYYKVQFYYEFDGNESLIDRVQWNFGDGNGSKDISPVHIYDSPGTYLVTVALFDEVGGLGYTTKEITIGGMNPDTVDEYVDWWVENKLLTIGGIFFFGMVAAGLYVGLARRYGGANKLVVLGIIIGTIGLVVWYLEATSWTF
jgi:hypothetical protein